MSKGIFLHDSKSVCAGDQHKQRVENLEKIMVPLIEAGFTRAEILRQGISGGDYSFMEIHARAIFKEHRQYMALKKYGLREDELQKLAAPYKMRWREFKMKFDMAKYNAAVQNKQWKLTFVEWFTLWAESGAWRIGNINEWPRYGMILVNQNLPYQIGNVRIVPMSLVTTKGWLTEHRKNAMSLLTGAFETNMPEEPRQ